MKYTLTAKSREIMGQLHAIAIECPHDVADIWVYYHGHVSTMEIQATAGAYRSRYEASPNTDKVFVCEIDIEDLPTAVVEARLQEILAELRAWLADDRGWSPEPLPDSSRPATPAEALLNATLTPLPDERRFQAAKAAMQGLLSGKLAEFGDHKNRAGYACRAADALLSELAKPSTTEAQP